MNYKVLYRKYRPATFKELVGQTKTKELLQESIKTDKIAHAYIFSGPRGTGKTSSAKIFAKSVNCLSPEDGNPCGKCENCLNFETSSDIYEIDAASNNGVDQIRELIDNIKLSPISMKYKVYIIDEVHMLSTSAFNALLLTLEEPPQHVLFILATTDIEDVPITVLSRCQRLEFRKISTKDIEENLKHVSNEENIDISDDAIHEIALYSDGGMRDALSVLDQISKENKKIEIEDVLANIGLVSTQNIVKLLDFIENNNQAEISKFINGCSENAYDIKTIIKKIILEIKEREIKIKSGETRYNLSYSDYKNLAFELSDLLTKNSVNIDSFILLELILLNYIKDDKNTESKPIKNEETNDEQPVVNELKDEIIPEEKVEKISKKIEEKPVEKVLPKSVENAPLKTSNNLNEIYLNKLRDVRINNCFVGAQKTLKEKYIDIWKNYLLHENDRKIKGLLSDTEVVMASKDIIVLMHPYDDNAMQINNNIESVEKVFNSFNNSNYKLVTVSISGWKNATQK